MPWLFASGHAADVILAVMAIELVWLATRGRWRVADAMLRLGPGALMVVALRSALTASDWPWIALPLLLSLPLHLVDLSRK